MALKLHQLSIILAGASSVFVAPRSSEAASCIPGFDFAVFAKDSMQIQGAASTDSWNSSSGTYAQTASCSTDGDIGTNSTSGGIVQIQASSTQVCGDVFVGAGGNPNSVIQQHNNATITGTKQAQTTNLTLTDVTAPSLSNGSPMSPSFQNTNATLTTDRKYDDVTCQNGSLTLSAGKYVVKTITLQANCELRLSSGPIEVYFTDKLQLQGGAVANNTLVPGNIVFYGTSTAGSVQIQGGANAYFAVYAPAASCQVQGNADVYGAMVCKDAQIQGNGDVHYDVALRNLSGGGFACNTNEVSRATPVVATISNQSCVVQGTFEPTTGSAKTIAAIGDVATWEFPFIKGHMRARAAASITTAASAFSSGTVVFDAANGIPAVQNAGCSLGTNNSFSASCRNVFTNTNTTPTTGTTFINKDPSALVMLKDSTAATVGALIAPTNVVSGIGSTEWQTIVRKVLKGTSNGTISKLGGVDRSTVGVIGPSSVAGNGARPTMAYFGGTDGMLHAVCASTGGTTASASNICPSLGAELWAFLPRVQLPLVRLNTARIDGSVRVTDVFGDFTSGTGTGTRSWKTILTFQTGFSNSTTSPAVYTLDITDPAKPILLWEYIKPGTVTSFELGVGLAMHAGSSLVSGAIKNLAVAQTNNGGSASNGTVVNALSLETGAQVWKFGYAYPTPPRGVSGDAAPGIPATGVPGGAVGVDLTGSGFTSDVVFGDLYGNLWRLNAATGASSTGSATSPIFSFSTNKHPIGSLPAILDIGVKVAVFGTGAYVDTASGNTPWTTTAQSLIGVKLSATTSINEGSPTLAINKSLTSGEKVSAQVLVVGTQVFVTTDNSDINSASYGTLGSASGHAYSLDYVAANANIVAIGTSIQGGASGLANNGTALYAGSSDKGQQLASNATTTVGTKVDTNNDKKASRIVWMSATK